MTDHTSALLHNTTDAQVWAREFIRILDEHHCDPHDEGWMIGWFANAIMTGYDAGYAASQRDRALNASVLSPVD